MTSISFPGVNNGFQVGINNGPIHLPSEPPEPRPEPLSTVPFLHDQDFVSRDALLAQIHDKSSVPGSRIVLIGLGGVGKTRLAIEYCHRVRQQSTKTWVFWVHASNTARCDKSLRDLADRAKIPGRQDRNVNIFQLVGNWLQDEKIGKWILVLDNVDDKELLRKPLVTGTETQANVQGHASTQPPLRYLLGSSNGSIIITSRNKGVALDIAGHTSNIVDVQPMSTPEALLLLQNKLDIHTERADMVQLVEELEFMPLAIIQAASYIIQHLPRCSVSQYLEQLRKSDRQVTKLLNHEAGHIHRDWEAKNSILLTWQISFDHIRFIRQSAADLLSLMSFYDWQGIPENLLRSPSRERNKHWSSPEGVTDGSGEEDTDNSSQSDLDHDFEEDIATLRDYSFIYADEARTVFTMHRLVQLTVRVWLTTQGQVENWKEQFISNLCQAFPTGEPKNWERCRQLFPHVISAISQRPESQDSRREWATVLYRGAWYASQMGRASEAREMASKSRKQRVVIFGEDSEEVLHSTAMLATACRLEGRWVEAEKLQVQVMETCKINLGHDHPDTLTSMAHLASTYWNQGRWGDAEQLQRRVIETRKIKLGDDHPHTLTSMNNLASSYWNQGRWQEAEYLQVQVMETHKAKLGEDHPDTLTSANNLALTYGNQGRWQEAEYLQVQVMETRKTKLGEDHPDTLTSMTNLAWTYRNQGQWEEAEQLQVQVMELSKTRLGVDHTSTLMTMANLAFTLQSTGRHAEAIDLLRSCVAKEERILGPAHPQTVSDGNTLLEWENGDLDIEV